MSLVYEKAARYSISIWWRAWVGVGAAILLKTSPLVMWGYSRANAKASSCGNVATKKSKSASYKFSTNYRRLSCFEHSRPHTKRGALIGTSFSWWTDNDLNRITILTIILLDYKSFQIHPNMKQLLLDHIF